MTRAHQDHAHATNCAGHGRAAPRWLCIAPAKPYARRPKPPRRHAVAAPCYAPPATCAAAVRAVSRCLCIWPKSFARRAGGNKVVWVGCGLCVWLVARLRPPALFDHLQHDGCLGAHLVGRVLALDERELGVEVAQVDVARCTKHAVSTRPAHGQRTASARPAHAARSISLVHKQQSQSFVNSVQPDFVWFAARTTRHAPYVRTCALHGYSAWCLLPSSTVVCSSCHRVPPHSTAWHNTNSTWCAPNEIKTLYGIPRGAVYRTCRAHRRGGR